MNIKQLLTYFTLDSDDMEDEGYTVYVSNPDYLVEVLADYDNVTWATCRYLQVIRDEESEGKFFVVMQLDGFEDPNGTESSHDLREIEVSARVYKRMRF